MRYGPIVHNLSANREMIAVVVIDIQEGVGEHAVGKGILVLAVIAKQILDIEITPKLELQSTIHQNG